MTEERHVLIVEDDPGTIKLLAQVVARAGYEPLLARSAREGLQLLGKGQVALLLLDLMMREMDGWALLRTIKADDTWSPIPVIIISARHPREDPVQTEAHAGLFVDYLVKPFEVDELVAKIKEILK